MFLTKFIKLILFIPFFCNCTNKEYRLIEANTRTDLKETRLGQTAYSLRLPDTFTLIEAKGKEGQTGYSIDTKESFPPQMFGFIEIDLGQRLGDRISDWGTLKEKVQSKLLDRNAVWKVYQTETGYYVATTSVKNIYCDVSSKNKNEIDTLISVISTLKKN